MVNLYWGENVRYENGFINGDDSTRTIAIVMICKMPYKEFVDLIYACIRVEKIRKLYFKLELLLCNMFQ